MSTVRSIDAPTLKAWLENDEAILVDVRDVEEYKDVHIPGAILMPLSVFRVESAPLNPDKKLVFHCKAGKRGDSACMKSAEHAHQRIVYNLEGGIGAWIEAGYPTKAAQ